MAKANPGKLEEEKVRFIKEIQPRLQGFSVTELAKACRCTPRYASLMMKGEYIPHHFFYPNLEKGIAQQTR